MADTNNAKWYVIHTYSGYENKVAGNIEKIVENRKMHDKILGVCIPLEKVVEVKDDKTVEVERMVFPGYVVVKLAVEYDDDNQPQVPNETWHAIRYTRGVTGFVGPESKPVPLTESEREELIRLRAEIEYIKAENEVIKKEIALREERQAALLKAKKQQSSKNSAKKDIN